MISKNINFSGTSPEEKFTGSALSSQSGLNTKTQSLLDTMQKELLKQEYKEIHLWDFPRAATVIRIKGAFRKKLIRRFINHFGSWRRAIDFINNQSRAYGLERKYSVGSISHWATGKERSQGKTRNMPLWVALEISKALSNNKNADNNCMKAIEENLEYCSTTGRGIPVKIKFPIYLTPELVSIIFHLYGDGYLGGKGRMSHYRQVNRAGLTNFLSKVKNSFGEFEAKIFEESKVIMPRAISQFYEYYFELGDCRWNVARINEKIKKLPKPFLLAGLTSFIIDEGSIGENIEIYSGNEELLKDLKEIIIKLGYICHGPRKKSEKQAECYRIYISLKSAIQFYEDIKNLKKKFPTCGLAQKEDLLEDIVRRQKRPWIKYKHGVMKQKIIDFLSIRSLNTRELSRKLNTGPGTLRDHLRNLEKQNKVLRTKRPGIPCLLWSKVG